MRASGATRAQQRRLGVRRDRGMVTAELALGTVAVVGLLVSLCWLVYVVVLDLRINDTAGAMARQAARNDGAGMAAVRHNAPAGADVQVRNGNGLSVVDVRLVVRPFGWAKASISLSAEARAVQELGAGG